MLVILKSVLMFNILQINSFQFIGVVVASMSLSDEELKTREALREKVFVIAEDHGNVQPFRIKIYHVKYNQL